MAMVLDGALLSTQNTTESFEKSLPMMLWLRERNQGTKSEGMMRRIDPSNSI
jgi:hypothetical protein